MNVQLFRQIVWRQATRVVAVSVGAGIWGILAVVIFESLVATNAKLWKQLPPGMVRYASGDLLTLRGVISVFVDHPLMIGMLSVIAVGMTVPAIAGARSNGTLELLLARPVERSRLLGTQVVAVLVMLAVPVVCFCLGALAAGAIDGSGGLRAGWMMVAAANIFLLFLAFAGFGLATSVSFNRTGPGMSLTLAFVLLNYFVEILGSFWNSAKAYQKYSLFDHFRASSVLSGRPSGTDFVILGAACIVPLLFAFWVFPRRDLAAPE